MWTRTYSKTVEGLTARQVWNVWTDVNQWHTWQDDIESAKLEGPFTSGGLIHFKPKGGPNIQIELTEVRPHSLFVDLTRFPLARMYDSHELVERGDRLEIKTTIQIAGPLSFLWRKLVVNGIVKSLPGQTDRLIEKTRNG